MRTVDDLRHETHSAARQTVTLHGWGRHRVRSATFVQVQDTKTHSQIETRISLDAPNLTRRHCIVWSKAQGLPMLKRLFGPRGVEVPVIGQGTWQLEETDPRQVSRAIRAGIDLGLTHIDTAEMYGSGRVEALVGVAINGRRDQVYLVSKVLPENASKRGVVGACEASLKRLGTDYLDCYLLHWPGQHPLEDTIAGFELLREQRKISSWGVSNFNDRQLKQAISIAGPGKVTCNQVLYHLNQRDIEQRVLPTCEANHIAVVGYTPFGRAKFPPVGVGGKALLQIAAKHGCSARQVALAFLTRRPSLFAIPKAVQPEHLVDNAGAAHVHLDFADVSLLDKAFPVRGDPLEVPML